MYNLNQLVRVEYLKNLDIRKAISFAVDRNSIIKDAYSNRAKLTNFPLNSTSVYYDNELKHLSYNTENANNYLKKAVLSLSKTDDNKEKDTTDDKDNTDEEKTEADDKATNNKENTSDKKDDKKDSKDSKKGRYFKDVTNSEVRALLKDVTFKIIVNKNNSERVKAATIISNNLEAIGIKTEIKDLEDDEMTKALDKKDYDLALIGCELPAVSDATYIIKQLGYDDKQLDKYLNALQNANSEDEIKSTYKTLQKYVKEKAIFIVKQSCVMVLKIYQSKVIPKYGKIVSGICGIVMFITKSSYIFKLCRTIMKINVALNIIDKLCYVGILICV